MKFSEKLNEYISIIDCTAKELSEESGISAATISRFRSGERVPDKKSLQRLTDSLDTIASKKGRADISGAELYEEFARCTDITLFDPEVFRANFNKLMSVMSVSVAELARAINYDPSYISRVKNGQRTPSDPEKFSADIGRFAVRRFDSVEKKDVIAKLIDAEIGDIQDEAAYYAAVLEWLRGGGGRSEADKSEVEVFLKALDDFDLNEFIRAIHFDEMKVPSLPFNFQASRYYYGTEEMKKGELDFFKATVLSKASAPVFMYSDMPMDDMAADIEFSKKYMFGLAMLLKKGLHLNIVHDLNRPFHELMLGLESHIPLYMTGQISPYYFKGVQNNIFCHFMKVSGAAALSGECVSGCHEGGRYYLTRNKQELSYFSKRASELLKKAKPLMEIHREDTKEELYAFWSGDAGTKGARRSILSTLPLYTATEEFLDEFLKARNICEERRKDILDFARFQRETVARVLTENRLKDEIPQLAREEFERHPISLSVSGMFLEEDLLYSYDDYMEHLRLTREFERSNENYAVSVTPSSTFRNINIMIKEGSWVLVSKNKAPVIHFIIRNPKLRQAIEDMVIPVIE